MSVCIARLRAEAEREEGGSACVHVGVYMCANVYFYLLQEQKQQLKTASFRSLVVSGKQVYTLYMGTRIVEKSVGILFYKIPAT